MKDTNVRRRRRRGRKRTPDDCLLRRPIRRRQAAGAPVLVDRRPAEQQRRRLHSLVMSAETGLKRCQNHAAYCLRTAVAIGSGIQGLAPAVRIVLLR